MRKTYKARPGAQFPAAAAELIGIELERLKGQNGLLTTAAIVDAARPVDSPLHRFFQWEDSIAAEHWRRQQAANLVNRIEVVFESDEVVTVTPLMVSVRDEVATNDGPVIQRGFVTSEEAMSSPHYREQIIGEILNQIKILSKKAACFKELSEILATTTKKVERLARQVSREEKANVSQAQV